MPVTRISRAAICPTPWCLAPLRILILRIGGTCGPVGLWARTSGTRDPGRGVAVCGRLVLRVGAAHGSDKKLAKAGSKSAVAINLTVNQIYYL